ncbi:leucine-rich repeat-containing protein 17-like isoform X1 [Oncorhynchus keta]|uniref:leucine-rich repeat-containing protein 17-like isoform X1 n=1 Tax=Oncorhynchus keta TaxID=8018 RepID=UPI0015F8CBB9|nr:leucine-rich repeat-containing protein 17-like isoform X1 [Oncorhynchus keta]
MTKTTATSSCYNAGAPSPSVNASISPSGLREFDQFNNSPHFFIYGVLEDLYFLSLLRLGGNPWVCNYSIHYLVYWLRLHPGVTHSGLLCHPPSMLGVKSVEDYVHSYNRACG